MNKWTVLMMIVRFVLYLTPFVLSAQDLKTSYEVNDFDKLANKSSDQALVGKIRSELFSDKSLSKSGRNIKIIVVDKEIVLKGPVASDEEKSRVLSIVGKNSAKHSIRNQLEVKKQTIEE